MGCGNACEICTANPCTCIECNIISILVQVYVYVIYVYIYTITCNYTHRRQLNTGGSAGSIAAIGRFGSVELQ